MSYYRIIWWKISCLDYIANSLCLRSSADVMCSERVCVCWRRLCVGWSTLWWTKWLFRWIWWGQLCTCTKKRHFLITIKCFLQNVDTFQVTLNGIDENYHHLLFLLLLTLLSFNVPNVYGFVLPTAYKKLEILMNVSAVFINAVHNTNNNNTFLV